GLPAGGGVPPVRRRRLGPRTLLADEAARADGPAGRPGVHEPAPLPPGRPDQAGGAGLVGLGSDRTGGGQHGRRGVLAGRRAGRRAVAVGVAGMVVRLGCHAGGRRTLLPGHRRRRERPAHRGGLEPEGLREQRGPAGPGHRPRRLTAATAYPAAPTTTTVAAPAAPPSGTPARDTAVPARISTPAPTAGAIPRASGGSASRSRIA